VTHLALARELLVSAGGEAGIGDEFFISLDLPHTVATALRRAAG
jgi:hypothetical protein